MNKDRFFTEFDPVSREEWMAKILKDLKGKPYDSLQRADLEGNLNDPLWHPSDLKGFTHPNIPKRDPVTPWMINEWVQVAAGNPEAANRQALEALQSGATSITFSFHGNAQSEWKTALKDILPQYVHLGFNNLANPLQSGAHLAAVLPQEQRENFSMHLELDPIGQALESGNWQMSSGQDLLALLDAHQSLETDFPKLRTATVRGEIFHNAGADITTELASTLAAVHEYLMVLCETGQDMAQLASKISVRLASGSDYFRELAKFRAFRICWKKLVAGYSENPFVGHLQGVTSQFYSTVYDPYNNLLRGTTQAMSAALGGCDLIRVLPYNTAWTEGNDFARRIARNTQLLMLEESHLGKVSDPAAGSYYVEHLTRTIAEEAWKQFQEIEQSGGLIAQIEKGQLQDRIHDQAQPKIKAAEDGEWPVLGVNLYPNEKEKMLDEIQETGWVDEPGTPGFAPLAPIRLVGEMEMQRLTDELNAPE